MNYFQMPAPRSDPSALDEQVDWLSYSHEQLYSMVHDGVDLRGATHVSASWAQLGDALHELADDLSAALSASADGWQGKAADAARTSLNTLTDWAHTTGDNATGVSGCVVRQVDNVATAQQAMPAPVPTTGPSPLPLPVQLPPSPLPHPLPRPVQLPPSPLPHPLPRPVTPYQPPIGSSQAVFAAGTEHLAQDPIAGQRAAQQAHQQAADVMSRLQTSSYDVSTTVPQFSSPSGGFGPHQPVPQPVPPTPAPPPVLSPTGSPGPGTPVPGGPRVSAGAGGGAGGGATGEDGGLAGSRPGPGATSGVGAGRGPSAGQPGGGAAGEAAGRPAGGPFGGAGGRRGGEDIERRSPAYLAEDESIFTTDERTAPPVIGDDWGA